MKCKYYKKCKLYSKDSKTCNETGGIYYGDRFAGCYEFNKLKKTKHGKVK